MISISYLISSSLLFGLIRSATVTVPASNGTDVDKTQTFLVSRPTRSAQLADPSPIGVSLEFSALPEYLTSVPGTSECLKNLAEAIGSEIPVRIGGTTQNDARYDPELKQAVQYTLTPADKGRPKNLTYGPEFIRLASTLTGPVTFGLTRKLNNFDNTLLAAKEVVKQIKTLYAIELENEPEYWSNSAPIAQGRPWNSAADIASQIKWQGEISKGLDQKEIIQAGNHLDINRFPISDLALAEGPASVFVKNFGIHSYPQYSCGNAKTNLTYLMSHPSIVGYMNRFRPHINAVNKLNKPAFFSETNSVACEGSTISTTFGAALWVVDYIMQSLLSGLQRIYFHHATLGNSLYSFWGQKTVGSPFYGAYFAALALKNVDGISMLDDGTGSYAAYLLTSKSKPIRVLLYNSNYRPVTATSSSNSQVKITLDLSGTPLYSQKSGQIVRLKGKNSEARADEGEAPDVAGLQFQQATCQKIPTDTPGESSDVIGGKLTVAVEDSEAVLIQFE